MKQKRPVNLDLTSLKFPPMAISSILHRISGVVLFLLFPALLYLLSLSLQSEASFAHVQELQTSPIWKLVLWAFSSAVAYHFLAGIRHILMDIGIGEGLDAGRRSALTVMILAVVAIIIIGIWIW